jgi:saccharopine dehydrogenase-like NADP-dependent oxidoreductase
MTESKILVIGGYGAVGQTICTVLGGNFPGKVIAAGRSYKKARDFSLKTNQNVLAMELNINKAPDLKLPEDVSLIVMCIEQTNTEFVEKCIREGIHYVDISATYELLSKLELLHNEAKKHNSTTVLSVGLTPGLTNLLAKYLKSKLGDIHRVDSYIMLGLGEVHGEASIRWVLENLNKEFSIKQSGGSKLVRSFDVGKQTVFPNAIGKRTAYAFNFSDQYVIPKTLGLDSASTWLCFDSAFVTKLFALSTKLNIVQILKSRPIQNLFVRILKSFQFGSDRFLIKVEAMYCSPFVNTDLSWIFE